MCSCLSPFQDLYFDLLCSNTVSLVERESQGQSMAALTGKGGVLGLVRRVWYFCLKIK